MIMRVSANTSPEKNSKIYLKSITVALRNEDHVFLRENQIYLKLQKKYIEQIQ